MSNLDEHIAEQDAITAACENGICDHAHCIDERRHVAIGAGLEKDPADMTAAELREYDERRADENEDFANDFAIRDAIALVRQLATDAQDIAARLGPDSVQQRIVESAYRAAAKELHHDEGICEIDDGAQVNLTDDGGAYVQAWLWIAAQEASVCRECNGATTDDGEGWDGKCGTCSDKYETEDE